MSYLCISDGLFVGGALWFSQGKDLTLCAGKVERSSQWWLCGGHGGHAHTPRGGQKHHHHRSGAGPGGTPQGQRICLCEAAITRTHLWDQRYVSWEEGMGGGSSRNLAYEGAAVHKGGGGEDMRELEATYEGARGYI